MLNRLKLCEVITHQFTFARNAGHSKWANIKHDKAIKDGEKATIFAKYSRAMRLAIQEANQPNPALNSKLQSIIDQALAKNMPMSTISKSIEKFKNQQVQLKKHHIEAKCCAKIFLIAEFYTENLSILKANMNTIVRKEAKTQLANCKHLFDEIGFLQISLPDSNIKSASEFEDKLTEDAIECDAQEVDEISFEDKSAIILCNPQHIDKVKGDLMKRKYIIDSSEIVFIPQSTIEINDDDRKNYDSLMKRIKQLEGFEKVYDNIARDE